MARGEGPRGFSFEASFVTCGDPEFLLQLGDRFAGLVGLEGLYVRGNETHRESSGVWGRDAKIGEKDSKGGEEMQGAHGCRLDIPFPNG